MKQCAEYINYKLPNETTQVTHLLDAIQSTDPGLLAAIVLVKNDKTPLTGKANNFANFCAYYLLPRNLRRNNRRLLMMPQSATMSVVQSDSQDAAPLTTEEKKPPAVSLHHILKWA